MKKIYFAAILAVLALSACSNSDDDKGDDLSSSSKGSTAPSSSSAGGSATTSACYLTLTLMPNFGDMCVEGEITSSDCEELLAEMNATPGLPNNAYAAEFRSSCPSGQTLKCDIEDEGDGGGFMYIYGSMFTGMTCEDVLGEEE